MLGCPHLLTACLGESCRPRIESQQAFERYLLERAPASLSRRLNTDFDGKVRLLGANVTPDGVVAPGKRVKVTLYWQLQVHPGPGWCLFTHVLDQAGEPMVNLDHVGPIRTPSGAGQVFGPSAWPEGKVIVDEQEFTVPGGGTTHRIQLVTGVWRGSDRMRIVSGARDADNRAMVLSLPIRPRWLERGWLSTRTPRVRVDRLTSGSVIRIDGKLDEQAWQSGAAQVGSFVDVSTGLSRPGSELGGTARLAWDDRFLYLGLVIRDATVTGGFDPTQPDPHLWTRDTAEIMLDPDGDGDNRDYYEIQINPQNLVFDSHFDDYNSPRVQPSGPYGHQEWSSRVESAVTVQGTVDDATDRDQGYTIEARVPWKSFARAAQVPPRAGDEWRLNFYAMQNNGGVAWSPILGQGNFHKASRFGRVLWAEAGWQPPGSTVALTPAVRP
ncbi:carbohydrate-binding family 9-like protein [Myxococcota bacterium]